MEGEGVIGPRCEQTGLSVPECSCSACLESMLAEFSPDLLAGEIRVTRLAAERPGERPRAA